MDDPSRVWFVGFVGFGKRMTSGEVIGFRDHPSLPHREAIALK
jgi:hypothetical protein